VARIQPEFAQLAAHQGVRFDVQIPARLSVMADPILLERVIRNLVDNAFKHGAKSFIGLSVRIVGETQVAIEILDDGAGIPTDEQEAIFEEFYQLKNPERDRARGLGLGLPIVRRLCTMFGGTCSVISKPGDTRFIVELRRSSVDSTWQEPTSEKATASKLQGQSVLILDDEADIRDSLAAVLTAWGCKVDKAGEPGEALTLLGGHQYSVLLIDYRLRGEYTGLRFIQDHKALLQMTASIMITGDANPLVAEQAEKLNVPVLRKPISPAELRRMLEALVDS
jgi:CheY-like chemotaxis protein